MESLTRYINRLSCMANLYTDTNPNLTFFDLFVDAKKIQRGAHNK